MRVLISTNIPSPYRCEFWNLLAEKCDVTVLFQRKRAKNRNEAWYTDNQNKFNSIFLKGLSNGNESSISFEALKYFSKKKYDVFLVDGYGTPTNALTIIYLKLFRKKYIMDLDGALLQKENSLKYKLKSFLVKGAEMYLSPSDYTDDFLVHYGVKKEKIRRFHFTSLKEKDILSQVVNDVEKQKIKNELDIKEKKIILSVGSFIYRKGFDLLINAARFLNDDCGVYIIGGEPTEEYFELIQKYDLKNVHFVGFMSPNELREYYKAADVFVFPTRSDIWGLVVNEAMACGLPVVSTKKSGAGLALVEEGKIGFLVDVEDVQELSERINMILKDDDLRKSMAQEALKKVKDYTIENMADTYYESFKIFLEK